MTVESGARSIVVFSRWVATHHYSLCQRTDLARNKDSSRSVGMDRSIPTQDFYSTTSVMTPVPTVLPPSRMATWVPMNSTADMLFLCATSRSQFLQPFQPRIIEGRQSLPFAANPIEIERPFMGGGQVF